MNAPEWLKPYLTTKVVLTVVGLLVLLGLTAWALQSCGDTLFNHGIDKKKANVNAGLANVANIEQNIGEHEKAIANLKEAQAAEKQNVNALTQDYLDSANVAGDKRAEAQKALANLDAAHNANATNVAVKDLEEKLKGL
jgi:tetratricopeptide (TPR) repeat protein